MTNIETALRNFERLGGHDDQSMIVKRTDHPHVAGDYFYAIRTADKHAWTPGETVLTEQEVAELWYAAECPRFTPTPIYTVTFVNA